MKQLAERAAWLAVGLVIATMAAHLFVGATAQAQGFTRDELVAASARVHAIEYAVATANGTWCENTTRRWLSGFMFDRPSSTPTEPVIYDVWPGSEAEKSGLRPGDRITHVNGQHLGYGKMAQETYARLSRGTNNQLVTVVTEGYVPRTVGVAKSLACGPGVAFVDTPDWLAATNGQMIFLSAGTASSLADAELATVVGHELAHITLRHHEKKQNRAVLGAILGAAVGAYVQAETGLYTGDDYAQLGAALGAISYSKRMERRADCRGVYYAARAGYDVNAAPFLWERLANTQRDHQSRGSSHPSHVERAFRTRLAADHVTAQLASGAAYRDIPIPECKEPKLKKTEREALLAAHKQRSATKTAKRTRQYQTLVPSAEAPVSTLPVHGFGRRETAAAVTGTPRWETMDVKTVGDVAKDTAASTTVDVPTPETSSQPPNTGSGAETELLAQLIAEFVKQTGRAPNAVELASLQELAGVEEQ